MENKSPIITISPELPIGTEFWFMYKNSIELGLVAAYNVRVTSCTDNDRSWKDQLFGRWLGRKQKDHWKFTFQYEVKIDPDIAKYDLNKKGDIWYMVDRRIYFSKEELKADLR